MGPWDPGPGQWYELARCPAPADRRQLWETLVDKTEHPERYSPAFRRAEVLDHDASTVMRRAWPGEGEPFLEWVRHEPRRARVEYRRRGQPWRRAQAVVDTPTGAWLVYEVDDPAAVEAAGIDAAYASRVLAQLVAAARGEGGATSGSGPHAGNGAGGA